MRGLVRFRLLHFAAAMAVVVAASSLVVNPATVRAAASSEDGSPGGIAWLDLAANLATPLQPLISALEGQPQVSTGSDGRLTFLLLGSDARGTGVSRTDSIMVVSVKNGVISAASIPRDTARIPNPSGGVYPGKVNSLVRSFVNSGLSLPAALDKFEYVVEKLLNIEIDYHALVWFNGLTTLVGKVDPIVINNTREIRDGKHVDDPSMPPGVYFPQSSSYFLYAYNPTGRPLCNGLWKNDTSGAIDSQYWCHRALPYVRSRKGPNNDDWVRARRQQNFVAAAIKAVSSSELSALVGAGSGGSGKWVTDMPITIGNATDLYNRLHSAVLLHQVVFKPSLYASRISGTSGYELKLTAVRQWAAQYLK